jgi:hypothetical protein
MKEQYTADYIELSIDVNDDNDDPPDRLEQDDQPFHKQENYQPTTALLQDSNSHNASDDDFVIFDGETNKSGAPKHENSLAIQVNSF